MKLSGWVLVCCVLFSTTGILSQDKRQPTRAPVTLPTSPVPTIPSDAMFTIGQQNGKIEDMSKRIDGLETDVKTMAKDVGELDVYSKIFGGFIVLIVAPLVYEWAKRHFFKNVTT